MSTNHPSSTQQAPVQDDLKRQAQAQQWRQIGIASVAAAAQQSSAQRDAAATPPSGERRIVTLRDIDYFAA